MPHDPGTVASILGTGSAVLALLAMARVACIDIRRGEIDPGWTVLAGWAALGAIIAVEGTLDYSGSVLVATALGGGAWLLWRLWPRWVGEGDIGLCAVFGACAGPEHVMIAYVLSGACVTVAAITYAAARGKRLLDAFHRHPVPAALSMMAALGPVFAWRIATGIWPETVPPVTDGAAFIALASAAVLSAGLIAGALPMAVRRRAAAKAVALRGHDGRIQQSKRGKET